VSLQHGNLLVGTFVALLVASGGYLSDLVLLSHPDWIMVDDVVFGVIVGVVIAAYEEHRTRSLHERLRIVREMNAFVRRELQIIDISAHSSDEVHRIRIITGCVDRVDWALRRLLPGKARLGDSRQPSPELHADTHS